MSDDVRINIGASFDSDGAEDLADDTRRIKEEFEGLAEQVLNADAALHERYGRSVSEAAERSQQAAEVMARMGEFQGALYVDIARQATSAGDFQTATRALMRGYQENEPDTLLDRAQAQLLKARREAASNEPNWRFYEGREDPRTDEQAESEPRQSRGARPESEGGNKRPPEVPEVDDRFSNLLEQRIRTMLMTAEGNMAGGRLGVANRSLSTAENYLEQLQALEGNTEEIKALADNIAKLREQLTGLQQQTGSGSGAGGGGSGGGDGPLDELGDLFMGYGMGGAGGIGNLVKRFAKFLGPGGLAALGVTATVGGAVKTAQWLENLSEGARDEGAAFLNLGRQLGTTDDLMAQFTEPNLGSLAAFKDLNFTSRQAGLFAAAMGMPQESMDGSLVDITTAGLGLARYTGAGTDEIAGLLRSGNQAGIRDLGEFAGAVYRAVRDGTIEGVSSSETFDSIESHLSDLSSRGLSTDMDNLAYFLSTMTELQTGAPKSLQGKAGRDALGKLVSGMTEPTELGFDVISLRALGLGSKEGLPSAEELGLEGGTLGIAEEYEALKERSPYLAATYLRERASEFDPVLLPRLAKGFEETFGQSPDMEFMFGTSMGLSRGQILDLQSRFGSVWAAFQSGEFNLESYLGQAPEDSQGATDSFGRNLGHRDEYLDYLRLERDRLVSAAAATQTWTDKITEWETAVADAVASMVPLEQMKLDGVPWADRLGYSIDRGVANAPEFAQGPLRGAGNVVENIMRALIGQESGGDADAVNMHTGAAGLLQILPSNIEGTGRGWDWDVLRDEYGNPHDVTVAEFLADPDLQSQIGAGKLDQFFNATGKNLPLDERLLRTFATWYGGEDMLNVPSSQHSRTPIVYGDTVYPSMHDYTREVLERYKKLEPDGEGSSRQELIVRFEGTGGLTVEGQQPQASALERELNAGLNRWATAQSLRWNQNNRRG